MGIRTTGGGGSFELAPAGMHLARCYRVIDCGTHTDRTFGKRKRTGYLFWELPNTHRADSEDPLIVAKRYTLSHHAKANLRLDLESWYGQHFEDKRLDDGGGFDLEKVLGRPALLNVIHSDDGKFANIASVNPLPVGMNCPAPIMETLVFSLDPFDAATFDRLSDGIKSYVQESEEYQALSPRHAAGAPAPTTRDGIVPGREPPPGGVSSGPSTGQPITGHLDSPYGEPPPSSYRAPSRNPGGVAGDLEDDIPF